MRHILTSLVFCLLAWIPVNAQESEKNFSINHGPYLQEVTARGATFVFNTSRPSFSYIELRKEGENAGKVKEFHPYKVVFSDSLASPWHIFSTVNPDRKKEVFSLLATCQQAGLINSLLLYESSMCIYRMLTSRKFSM